MDSAKIKSQFSNLETGCFYRAAGFRRGRIEEGGGVRGRGWKQFSPREEDLGRMKAGRAAGVSKLSHFSR